MKRTLAIIAIAFSSGIYSQQSEMLVPKDAVSVFSINNINLLQKISLDELVKYEFMEELQQELFDGSTNGRTLKDSGVDFDQRMNVFQGKSDDFTVSGVTFGVENRELLFDVFDDYQPSESSYTDVDFYSSYFNRIAIQGTSAILFRVTPNMRLVDEMTDSIWYARGNSYPWYYEDHYYDEMEEATEEVYEEEEEPLEYFEELETEENTSNPVEETEEYPVAEADPTVKTYYELRDSVEAELQAKYIKMVSDELFIDHESLVTEDTYFKNQLTHISEGIFYLDNSRNFEKTSAFWTMTSMYSGLLRDMEALYEGNVIVGDLYLEDDQVDMKLTMNYGSKLGSIYQELTDTKFDKDVLKYIHKDNSGFFTYNVNMRKAYEQAYDVVVPMLTDAGKPLAGNLLMIELMDELLNKDAIFGVYQGSMFGTFNGIQKVKTKKIVFDYNEETFDYIEREEEAEEDMPIFTLGFTTERSDIPEKILKRSSVLIDELHNEGTYWKIDNAVLNSAPMYLILQNGLFIITNDEDLAMNHTEGYGSEAISRKEGKKAKKSGVMYAYSDMSKAIEQLPRGMFNDQENEIIDVIRGKSGSVQVTSSTTTSAKTDVQITYTFDGKAENSGKYILDLINSLYVISK